jgi:hypothetical protein
VFQVMPHLAANCKWRPLRSDELRARLKTKI